jgi:hypothetical protein
MIMRAALMACLLGGCATILDGSFQCPKCKKARSLTPRASSPLAADVGLKVCR